jgi:hypothetical protein
VTIYGTALNPDFYPSPAAHRGGTTGRVAAAACCYNAASFSISKRAGRPSRKNMLGIYLMFKPMVFGRYGLLIYLRILFYVIAGRPVYKPAAIGHCNKPIY